MQRRRRIVSTMNLSSVQSKLRGSGSGCRCNRWKGCRLSGCPRGEGQLRVLGHFAMARLCILDFRSQRHLKRIRCDPGHNAACVATINVAQRCLGCSRGFRLDAKVHVSLAAGRALLYGLVVDEDTQKQVTSLQMPCERCLPLEHCVSPALTPFQP